MKKINSTLIFVIAILIILTGINILFMLENLDILKKIQSAQKIETEQIVRTLNLTLNPLSLKDFTKFSEDDIYLEQNIIALTKNCTKLKIATNEYQLYAINSGLKGIVDTRPTLHDILKELINNFNLTLIDIRITRTEGLHYYARAIFLQDNKLLNIDIKASDAIALAVRTNSPIYVSNIILQNNAEKIC